MPNYDPEEAPNGHVGDPESRKILWRPHWEDSRDALQCRCAFAIWIPYECWQTSLRKTSHTTAQIFHLPFNFNRAGVRFLPCRQVQRHRRRRGFVPSQSAMHQKHGELGCGGQSLVTFCPRVLDVLPDPFSLTSRLPALLDLLQTQISSKESKTSWWKSLASAR
ncbi:hypothetical protein I309_05523 [Cryptococcus deuterogattii LA55]|nr:hypothetical protein I309_05523 [Cryptococcus deuterogattii LA55]KIR94186.1 hypothetical protein I304_01823 [Cryptococcus deuterogattii CBS 10090]